MPRKSKADKHSDLLKIARDRFDFGERFERENRDEALTDLKFLMGEQWTEEAKTARAGRPILTINRMSQFVRQVLGDIKQSRPGIKVHPVDSGADPDTAEIYQGLIRNIEMISDAKEAYYTAAESQVAAGEGFWRVVTDYSGADAFEQDVLIEKIANPFSVTLDPHCTRQTGEDAKWCFVSERMSLDEFKEKYPDAKVQDFESLEEEKDLESWWDGESVRVAEYWYREDQPRLLAQLSDGQVIDITEVDEPPALPIVNSRKVMQPCWYRVVMSGAEILEEAKKWPGSYLPIVRLVGEQINIGEKTVRHGVIRHARDAQRMYNYWRSAQTETVALQPKVPYILDPDGIKGYERFWNRADSASMPYLPYSFANGRQKPYREQPPVASQGMANEIALAAEDMKATTGIYDAALGNRSNETSGKAIMARQQESDVGTMAYHDNLARAIQHTGSILIDLMPKIYDTRRVVRILGEDESEKTVTINEVLPTGERIFDLSMGKYDVTVSMGPSYSTKRMEAADAMLQAVNANPELWQVMGDLLIKNFDWPGAEEIAERLKKMLPPGIGSDDDDSPEAQQMAQMQAQQQQQMAQLQQLMQKLELDKKQAEAAEAHADAMETQAKAEGQQLENMGKQMELAAMNGQVEQVIQQRAMELLMQMVQPQGPM